jgi:hypothetical protein
LCGRVVSILNREVLSGECRAVVTFISETSDVLFQLKGLYERGRNQSFFLGSFLAAGVLREKSCYCKDEEPNKGSEID